MTENEKKLIQAKHRLEQAQNRNREKERKARTRRLIQEGAILEKVVPNITDIELDNLEDYLLHLFYPEGRTYSPPIQSAVILLALQVQAPAEAADVALLRRGRVKFALAHSP